MARSTQTKVKLVKTGDKPAQGWWNTSEKYRDTEYAVVHGRVVVGAIAGTWGMGSGEGSRERIQRFWQGFDPHGSNVTHLGWTDYRDDATDSVVRSAGLS